jgi:ribosomal protein S18 acetylase RimI-like enzyme
MTLSRKKMTTCTIAFLDEISEDLDKHWLVDGMAYETSHGVDFNHRKISLVISNEDNKPCGVLIATTVFAEIYVENLWVDSAHRGKGYGRKLLEALEKHFEGQGFNNINLVTSAFQAPEFYTKCGYTAEFTRINHINPQFTKTFFVKFFNEARQTQGLL